MENLGIHYGNILKETIKRKGLSINEVAESSELSPSRIYELQRQERFRPAVARKLAKGLGIDYRVLIGEQVDQPNTEPLSTAELIRENHELRSENRQLQQTVNRLVELLGKQTGFNTAAGVS